MRKVCVLKELCRGRSADRVKAEAGGGEVERETLPRGKHFIQIGGACGRADPHAFEHGVPVDQVLVLVGQFS